MPTRSNHLKLLCGPDVTIGDRGVCMGFIIGVADSLIDRSVCLPDGPTPTIAMFLAVEEYLLNTPELPTDRAGEIVSRVLSASFPCAASSSG